MRVASPSPKSALSQRAETQMAGRLGLPGSVATGGTEATIAGRRSAGKGDIRHPQICTVHQIPPHFFSTYPNIPLGMIFWRDAIPDSICIGQPSERDFWNKKTHHNPPAIEIDNE